MLESVHMSPYDKGFQEGYELGRSKSSLHFLTIITKDCKNYLSEERWERYKKRKEDKRRRYIEEHPDEKESRNSYYDSEGHIIKEKWVEEKMEIMECMGFPKAGWEDACAFVEKYLDLSPGEIARRIIRESEYKYI